MIATSARTILHRGAPRTLAVVARSFSPAWNGILDSPTSAGAAQSSRPFLVQPRYFSAATTDTRGTVSDGVPTSHETTLKTPGTVTRTLRVLDMDVVLKITEELRSVDVNSDGR